MAFGKTLYPMVDLIAVDSLKQIEHHAPNRSPTVEEVQDAINYAKEHNVIVNLKWHINFYGWASQIITPESKVEDIMHIIKNRVYPV